MRIERGARGSFLIMPGRVTGIITVNKPDRARDGSCVFHGSIFIPDFGSVSAEAVQNIMAALALAHGIATGSILNPEALINPNNED